MRIVVVNPHQPAYLVDIDGTVASMNHIVDGHIEIFYYAEDGCIFAADESDIGFIYSKHKKVIAVTVTGTFFICCSGKYKLGCGSISDELAKKYLALYSNPNTNCFEFPEY